MIVIGLDPGGLNSFGWACLQIGESGNPIALNTGLTSSAPSALDSAGKIARFAPVAMGIDAPLYWVREGDRKADADICKRICGVGGKSGTVSHVNSLRGACLVQGVLAARQAVETWPDVIVTEAHPKALLLIFQTRQANINVMRRLPHIRHGLQQPSSVIGTISCPRNMIHFFRVDTGFPTGSRVHKRCRQRSKLTFRPRTAQTTTTPSPSSPR